MDRAFILSEIKRTAALNGGKPYGYKRFESETGIKYSDWYGIFWARWSDALAETGFVANALNAPYDATFLVRKYSDLARDLSRLPSSGDLRLRARSEPGFPSHNTFARLGSKAEFIKQVADYCRGRDGYADVLPLCERYAPHANSMIDASSSPDNESAFGVVYLMKSGRSYKIGRSNSAGRREYELAIQLPKRAILIHAIKTDDPCGIEAYWHKRFGAKRQNGEWFALDVADVKAFKRRKFM
jgi:hypothetical protein